ncbi:MAG: GspE/PulE family protein [bacterium]|nr:GspE/PulE family protein [bacterium]
MNLIQQLLKKGVLDKSKATALDYEVKTTGSREEEIILKSKVVTEDFLFGLKSENLKIPLKLISLEDVKLKVLETIPEESAKYYRMIPLSIDGNGLEIGMVYPEDLKAREALEFLARQNNFNYKIFLITLSNFNNLLRKYRDLKKEVSRALEELETELGEDAEEIKADQVERVAEEAPISKVVAVILRHAVDGNASDIHIEPSRDKLRVRFRLDGILHSSIFLPMKILPAVAARIKILSNLKIDEARIPQDGRFSAKIAERSIDFRVSTLPTTLGEKVVMRILDPSQRKIDFSTLGISGRNLEVLERGLKNSYGMILSTGPTGSGKTTTLYAVLSLFNTGEENIMTLEDPVEYQMDGVNQSQVKPEIGFTFASGLRALLRQDPDIIMVGEIRDEETATLAVHAALTGHVVLSTLHTSNTVGVIPRLIDMGIQKFLLPSSLSLAIAQRLVRKLCPHCRKKVRPDEETKKVILEEIKKMPQSAKKGVKTDDLYVYQAQGCKRCNNLGYSGRIGIYEVLEMTKGLEEIIIAEPSESKIFEEARKQDMITMKQDGMLKVLEGLSSFEEILRVAEEK